MTGEDKDLQIKNLQEQLKNLIRTERSLYLTQNALNLQIRRIEELNSFAVSVGLVKDVALLMLALRNLMFRSFALDYLAVYTPGYDHENENAFLYTSLDHQSQFRIPVEVFRDHVEFFRTQREPVVLKANEMPQLEECLERMSVSMHYDFKAETKVLIPVYRERTQQLSAVIVAGRTKFENTYMFEKPPMPEDLPFFKIVHRHVFTAMENLFYKQELENFNATLEKRVIEKTDELVKTQTNLLNASRMSSLVEMAGGVAHEINNPLAIIYGNLQVAQLKIATPQIAVEELKDIFSRMENSILRVSRIISTLRSFARDVSQDPRVPCVAVSLVDQAMDLLRAKFENAGIQIRMNIQHPEEKVKVRAAQVSQALMYLLSNAYEAVKDDKIPSKWIEVRGEKLNNSYELRFMDSGPGIPAEIRSKIFDPFFTTKAATKQVGMGLSIALTILKENDGELFLDESSTVTCFVVHLHLN